MHQREIARRRVVAQGLTPPGADAPEEVVRRLGAVQAQDYLGALWAVGARAPGATEQTVARAMAEGRIVRTWPMRGTIHLVAPADVRWMLALLTPRVVQRTQGRLRQLGLDAATIAASARVLTAALEGGRHLTRAALFAHLEEAGISAAGQRGIHILGTLAQEGLLCLGARSGKQFTFALLDEWVPHARSLPRDEALAELARRYCVGHGPAAVQDFAWWSGLTLSDARAALAAAAPHLQQEVIDGDTYWQAAGAPDAANVDSEELADAVHLLPGFDEYLLGYTDRSAVLDPRHALLTHPGTNGMMLPVLVVGGRVVGVWKRAIKKKAVALNFTPFEPLTVAQKEAVAGAAERYGHFLQLPVIVRWQDVP